MYRFFVEPDQIEEKWIRIRGSDVNHIKNVLRCRIGEEIRVSAQGDREYACCIEQIDEDEILAEILYIQENGMELTSRIYLFQGIPKGDKMEWIIQKAVELGVYEVIPVDTKRSVVKLDRKKKENKIRRWQAISESAAKQSKRMIIPKISPVLTFDQAADRADSLDVCLIPYELAKGFQKTRSIMEGIRPGQSIGIFIGPEGGFDEKEVKLAIEHKIVPITLGRRILRTETAGMTVLSILMYLLEGK